MSENKKVEEKKTPNVWVTILCIVLIIVMFFVGWFLGGASNKVDEASNNDSKVEEKDEVKEVEKDVELVSLRDDLTTKVEMLERLKVSDVETGYMSGNIYGKNVENSLIPVDEKLYHILELLYWDYYGKSPVTTNYNFGSFEVYKDHMVQLDDILVEAEYKKMYGDFNAQHKKFDGCPMFIYDSVNNKYYGDSQCGGTTATGILTYINRVTTMGNEAYVYVSLGAWEESNIYTDFEKTKLYKSNVTNHENFINESNYKDFSEYKYTFINEEGNYIFKSLKKIK